MTRVAALYVDTAGIYSKLPGIETWGLPERDAREYKGPWPVVAHPPCARWSKLAYTVQARGGPRVGEDGACFALALAAVRLWGGVLEHPLGSAAWPAHGLRKPRPGRWWPMGKGQWVARVWQRAYGHPSSKPTLLLACGRAWQDAPPPALDWEPGPAPERTVEALWGAGPRRSATPEGFARALVSLALASGGGPLATWSQAGAKLEPSLEA